MCFSFFSFSSEKPWRLSYISFIDLYLSKISLVDFPYFLLISPKSKSLWLSLSISSASLSIWAEAISLMLPSISLNSSFISFALSAKEVPSKSFKQILIWFLISSYELINPLNWDKESLIFSSLERSLRRFSQSSISFSFIWNFSISSILNFKNSGSSFLESLIKVS